MPPDRIRVALIGFGMAGSVFHAPLISSVAGLELSAIVTANPDRRADAMERYPEALVFAEVDQLWLRAEDFDVVVVAAPNRAHVALANGALDRGLAVVVDKPLAGSAAEGRALVDKANKLGLFLTVFQNRRWDGDFLTVRKLLEGGSLGSVHRFESRFDRWRPELKGGWREQDDPNEAGGLLFDLGSHLIDQARVLFGPVTEVYAELDRRRPGAVVDDDSFVALAHESGVRSHHWMSLLAAKPGPRFRVLGDRASFLKHGLDPQESDLTEGIVPTHPGWGEDPEHRWGLLTEDGEDHEVRTEPGAYPRFYEMLAAAVRGEGPVPVDPSDAVAVLEVIEAASNANAEGTVVELAK
jgi:predicted dehydrogenase